MTLPTAGYLGPAESAGGRKGPPRSWEFAEWNWWHGYAAAALGGLLANPELRMKREDAARSAADYATLLLQEQLRRMQEGRGSGTVSYCHKNSP